MQARPQCETEIKALEKLSLADLRQRWIEIFKEPPSKFARSDYLLRGIAYHLQSLELGGISVQTSKRLKQAIKEYRNSKEVVVKPRPLANVLQPGARLLREWQGCTHEVLVLDDGFQYRQQTYQSLSVIARKITGTRWSGPRFFGLEVPKKSAVRSLANRSKPTFTVDLNGGSNGLR